MSTRIARDDETMKVWITKCVLTVGIREADVGATEADGMVWELASPGQWRTYYHGKDWWPTRKEAVVRAEGMRLKKIASLQKQIVKLKALKFDDPVTV